MVIPTLQRLRFEPHTTRMASGCQHDGPTITRGAHRRGVSVMTSGRPSPCARSRPRDLRHMGDRTVASPLKFPAAQDPPANCCASRVPLLFAIGAGGEVSSLPHRADLSTHWFARGSKDRGRRAGSQVSGIARTGSSRLGAPRARPTLVDATADEDRTGLSAPGPTEGSSLPTPLIVRRRSYTIM